MSLSTENLNALQQLMAQDKTLLPQVQATDDAAQAAAIIAQAAAQNGIPVSEADLTAHLQEISAALSNQTLSDQQLNAVAGGFMPSPLVGSDDDRMTTLSIMTLGLGCAIVSIGQRAGDRMNFTKKYC